MRSSSILLAAGLAVALVGCTEEPRPPAAAPSPPAAASTSAASPSRTPTTSPTAVATRSATAAPAPSPVGRTARLTGDGIDLPSGVLTFGTPVDRAAAALRRAFGRPSKDTGVVSSNSSYGVCPGTDLRALEYGRGALVVLFGNVDGPELTMYAWGLTSRGSPRAVPTASALVGDEATFEFGVGTTVAQARERTATGTFVVRPANEPFPASFTLRDQSAGFHGFLTGTAPSSRMTFVQAGTACGE